jgi:hypothetical protein
MLVLGELAMNESELISGLSSLDILAREEYREPLANILDSPDSHDNFVRIGRLIGVVLKEPFAVPHTLPEPSHRTRAYRAWELVGEVAFEKELRQPIWQTRALKQIKNEIAAEEPYYGRCTEYGFAQYAQDEIGFFGFFARSLRKYICGDKEIRTRVDKAVKDAATLRADIPTLAPESIVGIGGLSLGAYLVQHVPILGIVGAPVIAGVVVILYSIGIDSFCQWTDQLRTNEEEK